MRISDILGLKIYFGSKTAFVSIGHFRVVVNLIMKASLSAKLFIWKLVLFT